MMSELSLVQYFLDCTLFILAIIIVCASLLWQLVCLIHLYYVLHSVKN